MPFGWRELRLTRNWTWGELVTSPEFFRWGHDRPPIGTATTRGRDGPVVPKPLDAYRASSRVRNCRTAFVSLAQSSGKSASV